MGGEVDEQVNVAVSLVFTAGDAAKRPARRASAQLADRTAADGPASSAAV
ncbi:MAG: hypothetical protein ACOYD1_13490 [Candidatus Nanopelagicales bacterium]